MLRRGVKPDNVLVKIRAWSAIGKIWASVIATNVPLQSGPSCAGGDGLMEILIIVAARAGERSPDDFSLKPLRDKTLALRRSFKTGKSFDRGCFAIVGMPSHTFEDVKAPDSPMCKSSPR
jgi:hypothetical protein